MGFSDTQQRALQRRVAARHVRARVVDGKELSYVEGWFAIAQANRIFGFDGWDRETIEAKCVQAREARGSYSVLYTARVRVTVRAGDLTVARDGFGTGEGRGGHLGEAHDLAAKAAETDATKRALVTFGKAFGLSLYADRRRDASQHAAGDSRTAHTTSPARGSTAKARPTTASSDAAGRRVATSTDGEEGGSANSVSLPIRSTPMAPSGASLNDGGSLVRITDHSNRSRIDKSELALSEPKRVRDKDHLRYVGSRPCVVCGQMPADAHHVRFAQPKAFGAKVGDEFTVPVCRLHHRELHTLGNERAWWHDMGIDPLPIARALWLETHQALQKRDERNTDTSATASQTRG